MLEPASSLLILTDMQVKLSAVMHDSTILCKNVAVMAQGCRILGIPILWLEQYPAGLGPTIPEIAGLLNGQTPYVKTVFSSLRDPSVAAAFDAMGKPQVLLAGIETHVCIYQTAMDLLDRNVEVHVVADAVSSRTPANRDIGLAKIDRAGGHVTSVETALFELLGEAGGEHFKAIMKLIK